MGKSSGSAPQAPDPLQTAGSQNYFNQQAFDQMLNAGRVNTSGPTGSQTWNNAPTFDETGFNSAMQEYERMRANSTDAWAGGQPIIQPTRDQFTRDNWTQTTTLSPEQQQLYNQNTQSQLQQGNLLQGMTNQVAQATGQPLNFGSAPGLNSTLNAPNLGSAQLDSSYLQAPDQLQVPTGIQAPNLQSNQTYTGIQAPNLQSNQTQTNLQANPFEQINQRTLNPGQLSQGVNDALQSFSSQIGALDPMQFNREAADATYNQGTRYLDPQLQQQQRSMEGRLAEQGFVPGTPAYNQAMQNFQDTSNRAYAQARDQATTAGTASGQANFGNRLGALQSQIATALQGGTFQNAQQGQDFSQQQAQAAQDRQIGLDRNAVTGANDDRANAIAQQLFQNQGTMDQARNQATQQNFQNQQGAAQQTFQNQGTMDAARNQAAQQNFLNTQNLAQQQFQNQDLANQRGFENRNLVGQQQNQILQQNQTNQNSAAQQGFQNQLTAGQFGNQARQQSIAEILQQRNQPLNELAALRQGTQVQMPQGTGNTSTPNLQAPDIMGAYQNQYLGQLGNYNSQVAQQNSLNSLLGQGASLAAMYFMSDERLKTDIIPLGKTEKGFNLYSYKLLGVPEIGVMAQEVQKTRPDAVAQLGEFLAVDYSKVI